MADAPTFDVTRFIDDRRMNRFNAKVVVLCFFIILFDGYDGVALPFAGPFLVKAWGIASMAALGTAFSASLFGFLFGAWGFGWVGDHYGRNKALVWSSLFCGVFSLLTMAATSLPPLIAYRFLTGIGLGGIVPNVLALTAEYTPRRVRATMMIIMFSGITFGGVLPGPIAAWLAPTHGWQMLFLVGGVTPIVMAAIAAVWLPESIKHLVVKAGRGDLVARIVKELDPAAPVARDTHFVVADERVFEKFRPSQLFADGLRFITPLLWLCFILNLMSFYFINTWLPTVLTAAHVSQLGAVFSTSVFQFGGTLGGLAASRPIDRMGLAPVCVLFVCGLLSAPFIGFAQNPEWLLMTVIFIAGFTLLGLQFGLNAVSAMIYPTSIRSNGSGWAFAVGRFGSIAGPIVAGVLLGMHLPIERLFLFLLLPISIGLVCSLVLARLYYVRFLGMALERREVMDEAARAAP